MHLSLKKQGVEDISFVFNKRLKTYEFEMGLNLTWTGNFKFNLEELTPLLDLDLEVIQDLHPGNLGYKNQQLKIFDFAGSVGDVVGGAFNTESTVELTTVFRLRSLNKQAFVK